MLPLMNTCISICCFRVARDEFIYCPHCPKSNPRYSPKCGGKSEIQRGIFCVVSRFPIFRVLSRKFGLLSGQCIMLTDIVPMLPLLPCIPRARQQQQQQQQCSEFSLGHEEELVQRLCVDSNEKIPCQPFFPSPILPLHDDVPTLLSYILYTVVYICYTNCPRYPPRG